MQQATVERLADIENIIAIKDATGDVARGAKLIEAVKGRILYCQEMMKARLR